MEKRALARRRDVGPACPTAQFFSGWHVLLLAPARPSFSFVSLADVGHGAFPGAKGLAACWLSWCCPGLTCPVSKHVPGAAKAKGSKRRWGTRWGVRGSGRVPRGAQLGRGRREPGSHTQPGVLRARHPGLGCCSCARSPPSLTQHSGHWRGRGVPHPHALLVGVELLQLLQ